MARGTTLANLRLMLRAEIGQTLDTAAATQVDNNLNMLLATKQKWLASNYQWPFLQNRWDLSVATGDRYLAFPTSPVTPGTTNANIDFEHEILAEVLYNNYYRPLQYGIGADEYNIRNSDRDERNDPIRSWRWATNVTDTTAMRLEIWPIPVSAQTVRFNGQRVLNPLFDPAQNTTTNDAYKADLDDLLLVYLLAADLLQSEGNPGGSIKAAMASERLAQLRSKYAQSSEPVVLGQSTKFGREFRRTVPMIVVAP